MAVNEEDARADSREALTQTQQTIARQAEEIERLRGRLADETAAKELREALTLAATAGTIASPVTHSRLLEMIVETAAHIMSAQAAALLLIDEETHELVFEVALGQRAEEVKKIRVPLGHGIAGLVAVSGQPMAVADAQRDPRHASDIAQRVGYLPQSILCVPLFYHDQIIGVLELLDKQGAPSFSASDMATLGLFASQAAVAIEQSRVHRHLAGLIGEMLESLGRRPPGQQPGVPPPMRALARRIEEDAAYRQALDLAQLVQEIAWRGENELKICQTILRGFVEYLRSRPEPAGDPEAVRR